MEMTLVLIILLIHYNHSTCYLLNQRLTSSSYSAAHSDHFTLVNDVYTLFGNIEQLLGPGRDSSIYFLGNSL